MSRRPGPPSASEGLIPPEADLVALAAAAQSCTACPLYAHATQTVFGEGPPDAPLVLVGEQPGDEEDQAGHPFVGPAGDLLTTLLRAAGSDRSKVYVTNAVKHFKFIRKEGGRRRIHQRPSTGEIHACRGWLMAEVSRVKPEVIVALGAVAAQAFLGRAFRLTTQRGELVETSYANHWLATYHPSAALRAPTHEERSRIREAIVEDLRRAVLLVERSREAEPNSPPMA